jgi:DNA-nicking Smr family endonuclease
MPDICNCCDVRHSSAGVDRPTLGARTPDDQERGTAAPDNTARAPPSCYDPAAMKKRVPAVSDEDRDLFAQAIGAVRPVKQSTAANDKPRPPPEPVQSQRDEARVPGELIDSDIDPALVEVGEELSYLKDGHSPLLLRKLKRGQFSVADEIDLHQMTAPVAREAVTLFIAESKRERRLCVKIIHGKGLRSRNEGPVLKRLVDGLLRRRADVLAFASAKANQGGTGAVIVLLAN